MEILSLEIIKDTIFGYFSNSDYFLQFSINEFDEVIIYQRFDKREYKNYEQFQAIIGKFNPYVFFFVMPISVNELNFIELKNIKEESNE